MWVLRAGIKPRPERLRYYKRLCARAAGRNKPSLERGGGRTSYSRHYCCNAHHTSSLRAMR